MSERVERSSSQLDRRSPSTAIDETVEERSDASPLLGADSEQQPVVSVVLPTLDEEAGIAACIEQIETALRELGVLGEVVVSDSSTDRTPEIAAELGAIVVTPDEPGYGYAYRYGFARTRGGYIVMGDADTTYDFTELPALFERVVSGDADVVMGSRLKGEIKPGAMPALHQYVGNPLLTRFLNLFYDADVSDAHSGLRVMTREAMETMSLSATGMEFASEMVMEASVRDLTIEEVPITYHERTGEATLDSFRDGWRHVRFMLLNAPGYLFSVPGLLFMALGVLLMGSTMSGVNVGAADLGIHTVIAGSLLTVAGMQIASFGILATVASDPIRQSDPVTPRLVDRIQLEHGATIGGLLFLGGSAYALWLTARWIQAGFPALPVQGRTILAFTAIIIGLQVVFGSFCLSAVVTARPDE